MPLPLPLPEPLLPDEPDEEEDEDVVSGPPEQATSEATTATAKRDLKACMAARQCNARAKRKRREISRAWRNPFRALRQAGARRVTC